MPFPDISLFARLSERGNIIPLYTEILADTETPVSAFLKLRKEPSFLLESVEGGEKWARYSFLGIDPSLVLRHRGGTTEIRYPDRVDAFETADPLLAVQEILARFRPVPVEGLPGFCGGFVGFIGYDAVKSFERVPDLGRPGLDLPDLFFMLTDTLLVFDNLRQTLKVVVNVRIDGGDVETLYRDAEARIAEIVTCLSECAIPAGRHLIPRSHDRGSATDSCAFRPNMSRPEFMDAVARSREYVMAGDVVQVVLSQRFERRTSAHPFAIYRALRVINPSPYMYYLDTGEEQLVGSSPEILVRLQGDRITLRPIAGTRRRGGTDDEDKRLEQDLRNDPKEVAEHIMLVDLGRNDVGRVAATGTVKVTDLMTVERYSHVMHLVSNVEGQVKKGLNAFDVFRAAFPAGTVTGAPKVRAMEIIEELEPTRRGPYAGAVGYFSYTGDMDTCITIRTLIVKDGAVFVQAGAGVVADSSPAGEYAETMNKAKAMMEAVDFLDEAPPCS